MTVEIIDPAPLLVTPNRGFSMGHRVGPIPASVFSTRHLFGAVRPRLAQAADLSGYVDVVRNQINTQQCVGMALARVIHIQAQVQKFGAPNPGGMPYPSSQGIYGLAREEEDTGALVDNGSMPGLALQALTQDVGVPLDRDWPIDALKINHPLPVDVLARALAMKVTGAYQIDSDGQERSDACATALINNHAFSMAIQVGDSYENARDETPVVAIPNNGKCYGGHDISIVGFRTVAGRRQWLNVGSWGTSWGFGGYCWLDDSVITATGQFGSSNFIVTTVAPDFSLTAAHRDALNPPPKDEEDA